MMKRLTHTIYLLSLLLMLSACGGGGSLSRDGDTTDTDDSDDTTSSTATLLVDINTPDGTQSDQLSDATSLIIIASATDSDGQPLSGELVTFTLSDDDLASFDNDTGTSLTDAQGIATIGLLVGTSSGSGTITASITTDSVSASVGFTSLGSVAADESSLLTLSISLEDESEGNTVTETSPLLVSALVTDPLQNPIADELVTFTLSTDGLATFSNTAGTALTDASGIATIGLNVGEDSGSGLVTGTIASGQSTSVGFTSEGTATEVEVPASLSLFSSTAQLASSGFDTIELTAIVRNAQNVLLEGITVNFSADQQASLENSQPETDSLGTARANITTTNNPENRTITATASISGFPELSQEIEISVVGTTVSISGATSIIIGDSSAYVALLEDSGDNDIFGETVTATVTDSLGNDVTASVLTSSTATTSANGQAVFNFSASVGGEFTIVATALNATDIFELAVQEDQFGFVDAPDVSNIDEDLDVNEPQTLTLQWLRDSIPFVGGTVTLSTSRGEVAVSELTTDSDGEVVFTLESDNAGLASVIATGDDGAGGTVSATTQVSFIATVPDNIQVDATPDSIGPDGETSTISAVVRDADGNRVGNQVVSFSLNDVANGSLSPAQATTDRTGVASTVYTSSSASSNEGVIVTASIGTVQSTTTLTVGDSPFDISIGTGNSLDTPDASTYSREFSIFVSDTDGNPVANTEVTVSIQPVSPSEGSAFFKGGYFFVDDPGVYVTSGADGLTQDPQVQTSLTGCPSEDINGNNILDAGEDTNGDGQLTPGNVAVITPASITTDENGQAIVNAIYTRQFGNWVRTKVTARTESGGSESRESTFFFLPVLVDDLVVETSPPSDSPFGVGTNCADLN